MTILTQKQITDWRAANWFADNDDCADGFRALCDTAELGLRTLEALNPRCWSREMSEAWHRAIPDTQKAFDELRAIVATVQATS